MEPTRAHVASQKKQGKSTVGNWRALAQQGIRGESPNGLGESWVSYIATLISTLVYNK